MTFKKRKCSDEEIAKNIQGLPKRRQISRRHLKLDFTADSTQCIKYSSKKSIKKVNLINILLIIIRTLIILFFILMMSRPFYNANYDSSKDISSVECL